MTSEPLDPSQLGLGENVALPFIGKRGTETASTCETIVDGEGLNKIETSMKADGSFVNAIAFYNTNFQSWKYGQIDKPMETWEFQHDHYWNDSELAHVSSGVHRLVGVFGKTTDLGKIEQLGFVVLDT